MSTKRKPTGTGSSKLNFRPTTDPSDGSKGTKPTADRSSVPEVLLSIFLFGCRKIMFVNTFYRVMYYLALTFLVSIVMDFMPASKVISRKDSILNQYFVKVGWGWTLLLSLPFVSLTSFVHSCGKREAVIKSVCRLAVATGMWYLCTHFFTFVEAIYGRCNIRLSNTKSGCLRNGHFWSSVDISGHAFIMIYSTLVMIEESRVINNWESISDLLRDEEHTRAQEISGVNTNPLRSLSEKDFTFLSSSYEQLTPYIRALFIAKTGLVIIWELMLWGTVLYYHSMLEKFLAALIAISVWYATYYVWFPLNIILSSPGEGAFKYSSAKSASPAAPSFSIKHRKSFRRGSGTFFMGMPVKSALSKDEAANGTSS